MSYLENEAPTGFEIFAAFIAAIPLDVPIGSVRIYWHIDPLIEFDAKLMKVETQFRPALLRASAELIKRYG